MDNTSKVKRAQRRGPIYTDKTWVQNIIFACLLFFVVFQTYFIFYHSSYFTVEVIRVKGNKEIRDQEIIYQSRLSPGQKMIELDFEEIAANVEKNPIIKSASILQSGAKEIQISVVEFEPVEYFLSGGDAFGLSLDGVLIPKKLDVSCRVEISLSPLEKQLLKMKKDRLSISREWLNELKKSRFFNYDRILIQDLYHIWLYYDGFKILLGDIEYFVKHKEMLSTYVFSYDPEAEKPEYIDVRFENMVVKLNH
ncbi:MAG: FtsQ-type POTRA domain-containing protein [Candidatus Cloacimonetes bacterium]|nr:FtsQ-type POTRA domain-containing protein [Candidatus Cloacimonadota bacterium]